MTAVVVQGCTLLPSVPWVGGTFTFLTPPSTKCKAGGAATYGGSVQVSVMGMTGPGAQAAPAVFTFSGNSVKCSNELGKLLLEGLFSDTVSVTWTAGSASGSAPCTLQVLSAGQMKVTAN